PAVFPDPGPIIRGRGFAARASALGRRRGSPEPCAVPSRRDGPSSVRVERLHSNGNQLNMFKSLPFHTRSPTGPPSTPELPPARHPVLTRGPPLRHPQRIEHHDSRRTPH